MRRLLRWSFGAKSQPDVLVALLLGDLALNVLVPKEWLETNDDRIGVPAKLRPWLVPIKSAAVAGLLLGRRWPKFGALTAVATTLYFVVATGYHVRAKDNVLFTAPALIYGGAAARATLTFAKR
jgi:hypothetical protein